jgi:hypothetical protein
MTAFLLGPGRRNLLALNRNALGNRRLVRRRTIAIRPYSTNTGPRGNGWAETIAAVNRWWREWAVPAELPRVVPIPTPAPTPTPVPQDAADEYNESGWRAEPRHRENPDVCLPIQWSWLFRSAEGVVGLFDVGLRPRGSNFNVAQHVLRSGLSPAADDAYYGASHTAGWKGEGPDAWEGPLYAGGRYLIVLHEAWGVQTAFCLSRDVYEEREVVVHGVPPHKCVAYLDKATGQIVVNPTAGPETAAKVTALLEEQYRSYQRRVGPSRIDE